MLYIITSGGKETQWHIGDHTKDHPWFKAINPQYVEEIQADGDELQVIWEVCGESLPMAWQHTPHRGRNSLKRVQRWFGDHAKFIFANVVLEK